MVSWLLLVSCSDLFWKNRKGSGNTAYKFAVSQQSHNYIRAVAIRFGVVWLVVRPQKCYTLGGSGDMLPQKKFEI